MDSGDLTWLPSDVTLLKFDKTGGMVTQHTKTSEPSNYLVLGEEKSYYMVLYEGERWYARKVDAFETIKKEPNYDKINRNL